MDDKYYTCSKQAQKALRTLFENSKYNETDLNLFCKELLHNYKTNNRSHSHKMTNSKYNDCKNVHYKNDVILLYKKSVEKNKVYIDNVGSHSQLLRF